MLLLVHAGVVNVLNLLLVLRSSVNDAADAAAIGLVVILLLVMMVHPRVVRWHHDTARRLHLRLHGGVNDTGAVVVRGDGGGVGRYDDVLRDVGSNREMVVGWVEVLVLLLLLLRGILLLWRRRNCYGLGGGARNER